MIDEKLGEAQKNKVIAACQLGLLNKYETARLLMKISNNLSRDAIEEARKIRLDKREP